MELLHKSLSLSSIANLLSRRRMLMGAGVLAATAGERAARAGAGVCRRI